MKKLLWLFVSMITISSCTERFQENKFKVIDIIPSYQDSTKQEFSISFKVNYYSDSTKKKAIVYASTEKGLSGSDDSIVYFGTKNKHTNSDCIMRFDSFVNTYNTKQFNGEISNHPVLLPNLKPHCALDSILLILYNKKSGIIDTITSAIRDNPYQL